VIDHPVIQVDVLPTAIAAAGGTIQPEWKLDGANLLPCMEAKTKAAPHEALYWRFGVQYAIRQGDWKLVKPHIDSPPLLFNLIQDPGEQTDLAASQPGKAKQLQQLWDAWNANNESPRWIDVRWNGNGPAEKKGAKRPGAGKGKANGTNKATPKA
jgi:arylsulfatase A-like enzyme